MEVFGSLDTGYKTLKKMSSSWTCFACLAVLFSFIVVSASTEDNCETLTTEVLVTKDKLYEYNGRSIRLLCAGKVPLRKCEGSCTSQVSPSVVHFPGFKKDCKCCRESILEDKVVTLHECFDGANLIPGQEIALLIKQPTDCQCQDCAM